MAKYENRKCIYCNKEYTPRVGNQKTCGAEECKNKLKNKASLDAYFRNRALTEKAMPKPRTVKEDHVCKGCMYAIPQNFTDCDLRGTCDYARMTGHSRLKIEMENGGYRTDSCPCYEKGKWRRRKVQPI